MNIRHACRLQPHRGHGRADHHRGGHAGHRQDAGPGACPPPNPPACARWSPSRRRVLRPRCMPIATTGWAVPPPASFTVTVADHRSGHGQRHHHRSDQRPERRTGLRAPPAPARGCSQIAAYDVQQWGAALGQVVPAAQATINCNNTSVPLSCTIQISLGGKRDQHQQCHRGHQLRRQRAQFAGVHPVRGALSMPRHLQSRMFAPPSAASAWSNCRSPY